MLERANAPTASGTRFLHDHAFELSLAGLATRCRALTQKWLKVVPHSNDLRLADAVFGLYLRAPSGSELLDRMSSSELEVMALRAIADIVRGNIQRALATARRSGWFMQDVSSVDAFVHVIWGMVHAGRTMEALALVAAWRDRHAEAPAAARSTILRTQAWLDSARLHFRSAELHLEEALEVAPKPSLQRCYAEADLAYVRAALGRRREAERLMAGWRDRAGAPLHLYRQISRAAIFVLDEDYDAAWRAARAVATSARRHGNASLEAHALFWAALSAPTAHAGRALQAFRDAVSAVHSVLYATRLGVLERASEGGRRPLRDCFVMERGAWQERKLPLARLWAPDAQAVAADLYYDTIHNVVRVAGAAPLDLAADSLLTRALGTLLSEPGFSLPIERFYEILWGEPFHRLRHGTKLHVALHRLRGLLRTPERTDLLHVRGGRVTLTPGLDVRVLEGLGAASVAPLGRAAHARVLDLLDRVGPLTAREVGSYLGLGKTATRDVLIALTSRHQVERTGAARATRYTLPAPRTGRDA